MDWIINLLQEREEYKIDKFYTELLTLYADKKIELMGFCIKWDFQYHWRSELRYKLQTYRRHIKESYQNENGDLERIYLTQCMIRFLKQLKNY